MNNVTLVVLSRYPSLFEPFCRRLKTLEPDLKKILVRDGDLIVMPADWTDWTVISAPQPFNFARNMNIGWNAADKDDIIICGDDVEILTPFVAKMRELAYGPFDHPDGRRIGFVTPQLYGQSAFVWSYIRRDCIEDVGPMDERFGGGYGYEDTDWGIRMTERGWNVLVTEEIRGRHNGGTSFGIRAAQEGTSLKEMEEKAKELFRQKWGKKTTAELHREAAERWLRRCVKSA